MNRAQDWYEMCLVKKKLDDTMLKIEDMFINISSTCQFKKKKCSIDMCGNEDHINSGSVYNAHCELDTCPIVENGIIKIEKGK